MLIMEIYLAKDRMEGGKYISFMNVQDRAPLYCMRVEVYMGLYRNTSPGDLQDWAPHATFIQTAIFSTF